MDVANYSETKNLNSQVRKLMKGPWDWDCEGRELVTTLQYTPGMHFASSGNAAPFSPLQHVSCLDTDLSHILYVFQVVMDKALTFSASGKHSIFQLCELIPFLCTLDEHISKSSDRAPHSYERIPHFVNLSHFRKLHFNIALKISLACFFDAHIRATPFESVAKTNNVMNVL